MKKIRTILLALSLACANSTWAQEVITVRDDSLGKEEVIDLPEGMTLNADSLLKQWNAKKYLVPDTTCENPNYNPPYPKEVFVERLRRIPSAVELPHNSVVQQFIDQYTGRLRKSVSYMLGACNL